MATAVRGTGTHLGPTTDGPTHAAGVGALSAAVPVSAGDELPPATRRRAALLGTAIGLVLIALASLAAFLLTAALFGSGSLA